MKFIRHSEFFNCSRLNKQKNTTAMFIKCEIMPSNLCSLRSTCNLCAEQLKIRVNNRGRMHKATILKGTINEKVCF